MYTSIRMYIFTQAHIYRYTKHTFWGVAVWYAGSGLRGGHIYLYVYKKVHAYTWIRICAYIYIDIYLFT